MNPQASAPWLGLSAAALGLGRDAQSEATFRRAVELEADPALYRDHALDALGHGRDALAYTAVQTYLEQKGIADESGQYAAISGAIALLRLSRSAEADSLLANIEAVVPPKSWTLNVVQFLRGHLDGRELLRRAGDIGERTEAHAYIGFKAQIEGRTGDAITEFMWVSEQGARTYFEYRMAKSELERLRTGPVPATK